MHNHIDNSCDDMPQDGNVDMSPLSTGGIGLMFGCNYPEKQTAYRIFYCPWCGTRVKSKSEWKEDYQESE